MVEVLAPPTPRDPAPLPAGAETWRLLAGRLADSLPDPVVVLDEHAHIALVNRAAEKLLGRPRCDLVGVSWFDGFTAPERLPIAKRCFAEALAGGSQARDAEIRVADGKQFAITAEFSALMPSSDVRLVIARITSVTPLRQQVVPANPSVLDYEIVIDARPEEFGTLKRVAYLGVGLDREVEGKKCYQLLMGRTSACEDCPVPRAMFEQTESVSVRADPSTPGGYLVLSATPLEDGSSRIRQRSLRPGALEPLVRARVNALAERANLSSREAQVLGELFAGRSLDDIATDLAISVRTVKFHQANVLQKLGADSRTDLMRLLF